MNATEETLSETYTTVSTEELEELLRSGDLTHEASLVLRNFLKEQGVTLAEEFKPVVIVGVGIPFWSIFVILFKIGIASLLLIPVWLILGLIIGGVLMSAGIALPLGLSMLLGK